MTRFASAELWYEATADELAALITETRRRTLELVRDLSDEQWLAPYHPLINPTYWELCHIAFFYESFALRELGFKEVLIENGRSRFDSFVIAHRDRWTIDLPSRAAVLDYLNRVQDAAYERLTNGTADPWKTYLYLLSAYHEDMHGEAFTYTRQTLGYPAPQLTIVGAPDRRRPDAAAIAGDVSIPGGFYALGAAPETPFVFDNEKWAHPRDVAPFAIARTAVTNAEFAEFVDDAGYGRRDLWSYQGWKWRTEKAADHPIYWRQQDGRWHYRHYDRWLELAAGAAVIHVSWYEAEAYCNWAQRRLPSELQWEVAACTEPTADGKGFGDVKRRYPWGLTPPDASRANLDGWWGDSIDVAALPGGDSAHGCRQMIGNTWEWTATAFYPYPGYILDYPYREYSAPWFGDRKVLRGGAWSTRAHFVRNSYRNFFEPWRRDVYAGFRTCAR